MGGATEVLEVARVYRGSAMHMHPDITHAVATQKQSDLIAAAERYRIVRRAQGSHRGVARRLGEWLRRRSVAAETPAAVRPPASAAGTAVVIRLAGRDDQAALRSLALLDGSRPLAEPVVVAVVSGELWAARSLADGRSIGDPFRQTVGLGALLELRARQLTDPERPSGAPAAASSPFPAAA
jgi:hypothetical protein